MAVVNYESVDAGSRSRRLPERRGEYPALKPYRRRLAELTRLADPHIPTWRALNEFMHPWSGRRLFGRKDRSDMAACRNILNGVVHDAARTCSSGLHGGLTSPSKPWFEITHPDGGLMEDAAVKGWTHATQEIMRSVLAKSNFYSAMPELYLEAIVYGTAAAIIDPDPETGVRFRQLTIGEYLLGIGEDLRVDTLYRYIEMTAAGMRGKFGADNPGYTGAVRDALRDGNPDGAVFNIVHAIQPIGHFDGGTHRLFKYESVYFMEDADDGGRRGILLWQGHRSQPFVAVRWATTSDDVYGYSPGMMCLSDNRMLQTMERDYLNALELAVRPPTTGPAHLKDAMGRGGPRPGEFIPSGDGGDRALVQPIYQVRYAFAEAQAKMELVGRQIQNKFFNHLFLSLLFNAKPMTATEVAQRLEEKAMVLGPVLERFQSELFDPVLDRVFAILHHEYRVIPEPPEAIAGSELKIEYVGALAQTVRATGLTNIANALPLVASLLGFDPAAAVKLNVKELVDIVAERSNWEPKATRSDEECLEIEQAAAQARQQAMAAERMKAAAGAAKVASETSLAPGSLLTGAEGVT